MGFQRNERVEVCSKEEGFIGSYYAATIIDLLIKINKKSYVVQYDTLLEDDESEPLIEIVREDEVRPIPPPVAGNRDGGFVMSEKVDAFDNDGWWVGKITGRTKSKSKYFVYFDTTGEEIAYPLSQLRGHRTWVNGKWWRFHNN